MYPECFIPGPARVYVSRDGRESRARGRLGSLVAATPNRFCYNQPQGATGDSSSTLISLNLDVVYPVVLHSTSQSFIFLTFRSVVISNCSLPTAVKPHESLTLKPILCLMHACSLNLKHVGHVSYTWHAHAMTSNSITSFSPYPCLRMRRLHQCKPTYRKYKEGYICAA